jgi:hypothetical protein
MSEVKFPLIFTSHTAERRPYSLLPPTFSYHLSQGLPYHSLRNDNYLKMYNDGGGVLPAPKDRSCINKTTFRNTKLRFKEGFRDILIAM